MLSSGYTVTKKRKMEKGEILVSAAFILILSSFFIGLFFLGSIQEALYEPTGYWFFEPIRWAYYTFMGSIIMIGVFLLILAWLFAKGKNGKLSKLVVPTGITLSIIVMILCVDCYNYANKEGITLNRFWGLGETSYAWDDVETITQKVKINVGVMTDDSLIFKFKDGTSHRLILNNEVIKSRVAILFEMEKRGIEIIREIPEEGQLK